MSGAVIISFFNQAGGVGKTTLTQNIGYQLAVKDKRVVLVDMDPQASLTKFMGVDPDTIKKPISDSIIEEVPLTVFSTEVGVDLCPSNRRLSTAEMQLVNADLRDYRLKEALSTVVDNYDYILIDCPPSLGLLSYISLVASTHVVVPVETHLKAFEGTNEMLNTFSRVKRKANKKLEILGFVPTRFAKSNSADVRTLEAMTSQLSSFAKVFNPIPRATAFVDASEQRVPLAVYDKKHAALKRLDEIVVEMEKLR